MQKNYPRYTLRVSKSLLDKIAYIAEFNGRTKNKEIEITIRKHVYEFERMYGAIEVPAACEDELY